MFSPRLFGSFILLYVSLFKFWEFLGFVGGATLGGRISGTIGYALLILLGFVLLSYIVGGLGLIMRRTWSATVVFYAAIVEAAIILFGATAILYAVLEGTQVSLGNLTVLSVLPILMYLVIPGGIAYVARSLQKKPELWQPSQQKSAGELETGYAIQVEPQQPAWLRKTFWVITVTGLVLPAIMGMIVTTLLLSQGKQAEVSGYDLFFFIFGTVLFALPYIVLSFIARSILMKAVADGGYQPVKRLFLDRWHIPRYDSFYCMELIHLFSAWRDCCRIDTCSFHTFFCGFTRCNSGCCCWVVRVFPVETYPTLA